MTVKSSWSPGDVLAAADLTDTFGSKATYSYGTATPGSPATGQIWIDTTAGTAVPVGKVYTGSGWVSFSNGAAVVTSTTGSPTVDTSTRPGKSIYKWTGDGSLTVSTPGWCELFLVGGGGGCGNGVNEQVGAGGGGGVLNSTKMYLETGTHDVKIGLGGVTGSAGSPTAVGPHAAPGGGAGANTRGTNGGNGGSGGGASDSGTGGKGLTGFGNNGGNSGGTPDAGGGGGAGGAASGPTGGIGLAYLGTTYATGGTITASSGPAAGVANSGNGGGVNQAGSGIAGSSGVAYVVIG